MNVVFVALGSNTGNRTVNLNTAITKMNNFFKDIRISSFYETKAEGMAVGHDDMFLNGVIEAKTNLSASEVLDSLLEVESQMGRIRTDSEFYLSRIIDLDLLLFNNDIIESDQLIIPHPRMTFRKFVMQPLCELAPELILPGTTKSVKHIADTLNMLQDK